MSPPNQPEPPPWNRPPPRQTPRVSRTHRPPAAPETSWFGNWSLDEDPEPAETPTAGETPAGRQHLARRATDALPSFVRIYRTFAGARAGVGLVLLTAQIVAFLLGSRTLNWAVLICTVYALETQLAWWLRSPLREGATKPEHSLRRRQWAATIGVDLATFGALHLLTPGSNVNYQAFLVLPVMMAGVLTSRRYALAVAAAATLFLLGAAWWLGEGSNDVAALLTQAGLLGGGLFAISVLSGELSTRLAREEESARGSLGLARQQAQINRLVIDEMHDGVLVVDRRGRVRTANPAARRLLSAYELAPAAPFPLHGRADWRPLVEAVELAFTEGLWPDTGKDVTLRLSDDERQSTTSRALRLRVRFTRSRDSQAPEDLCVLFLEDVRSVQARSRQEKLAAMGRMSAGIAHEIRNPLAAIAQANALLAEDSTSPTQQQLTRMVQDNVERLKRIVDDILTVAPGVLASPPALDIHAQVAAICTEWRRTAQLPVSLATDDASGGLHLDMPQAAAGSLTSRFEPDHLRRVLINLLDNAWRHSTQAAGAVRVSLQVDTLSDRAGRIRLAVSSDGEPIPPEVERSLFEPFFSTRSRGTGLGLYISRELCERYGASIDYRQHPAGTRHRNEFFLTLRAEASTPP